MGVGRLGLGLGGFSVHGGLFCFLWLVGWLVGSSVWFSVLFTLNFSFTVLTGLDGLDCLGLFLVFSLGRAFFLRLGD